MICLTSFESNKMSMVFVWHCMRVLENKCHRHFIHRMNGWLVGWLVGWMAPSGFCTKQSQIMCARFVLAIVQYIYLYPQTHRQRTLSTILCMCIFLPLGSHTVQPAASTDGTVRKHTDYSRYVYTHHTVYGLYIGIHSFIGLVQSHHLSPAQCGDDFER